MELMEKFILMVQAQAIVRDIQGDRNIAASVIDDALTSIDYQKLSHSEELGTAARLFVNWEYNGGNKPNFILGIAKHNQ